MKAERKKLWRLRKSGAALVACVFASGVLVSQSQADQPGQSLLKISSVNGIYDINHSDVINVHPGDVVNLSADVYDASANYAAEDRDLEQFVWQASDSASDICYADDAVKCESDTNFQVNDYGVSYYPTSDMPQDVQITVYSNQNVDVDSTGKALFDVITLHNLDYQVAAPAPVVITSAEEYPYPTYDDDRALQGHGRWVTVEGVRYFTPYTYVASGESEWEPYRNGYWSWDAVAGWTWISYDPWGWATDHRGVWRHHESYGWLWLPFEDHHYEPHCVTWFNQGEYVGWYPYFAGYNRAYQHGYERGFNDGFERGLGGGRTYDRDYNKYHPGYTIVHQKNVTNINIIKVTENRTTINKAQIEIIRGAHEKNTVYRIPGGNVQNAHEFINGHASTPGVITATRTIVSKGGARIEVPEQKIATPAANRAAGERGNSRRPIAIGTVTKVTENSKGVPSVQHLPPTLDKKGVSAPPVIHDSHGNPTQEIGVQTRNPAKQSTENPISRGRQEQQKNPPPVPVTTRPVPTQKPKPEPTQPKPQPPPTRKPVPAPQPKPVPVPQPKPVPAPQPKPVPAPQPKPVPAPQPKPVPAPQPKPVPVPQPKPVPAPQPKPVPAPQPKPVPAPQPKPVPAPQPKPQPTPKPRPQPAPQPKPQPAPQPRPQPAPQPRPQPAPQPRPQPAPQPRPQPAPQPRPQPAPQPRPQPAPQPKPQPPHCTGKKC